MSERGWVSVTRREPCAICNHDSWCTRSADGAVTLCRRTGGEGAVERTDRVGAAFWIHVSQNEPHRRSVRPLPPPPASESNLAHPEQLGAVYSALLRELSLSQEHRDNLRTRALSDRLIIQAGYRSMPLRGRSAVAGRIVGTFGEDTCAGVPGLYLAEGDLGRKFWTLGGSPGLIIPVRDIRAALSPCRFAVERLGAMANIKRCRQGVTAARVQGRHAMSR